MSVRLLTQRLIGHGRRIFHHCCHTRNIHLNILEHQRGRGASAVVNLRKVGQIPQTHQSKSRFNNDSRFFRFGQHARQLFVDNIINRVSPITYSANLRADATKRLLYGDSAPFLSLIGVSLATGGILTKEDELEGVCWEIREAVSRLQRDWGREEVSKTMNESFGLADLDIGPPIAKGCAAVVYAASLKSTNKDSANTSPTSPTVRPATPTQQQPRTDTLMSPIQNTSRFVHNFGGSVDNVHLHHRQQHPQSLPLNMDQLAAHANRSVIVDELRRQSMAKRPRFDSITESEYERTYNREPTQSRPVTPNQETSGASLPMAGEADIQRYPLAVKMMFNYDIQSNAMAILRAMYKETIPARNKHINGEADTWEKILREQTVSLPPHPNIVLMFGVFCDQVPNLAPGSSLYPMALPQRLNPQGYGRNMSLFLLMKRYNHRLCDYLQLTDVQMRTRILLFAQMLEGVTHLNRYGVAHRDLKSDNILIDLNDDVHPVVVLSDFGCCLADRTHGLHLPFATNDVDKGGNAALMAPEIIGQAAGTFSMLNYTKADLWACGTIAYEIFGQPNPFYHDANQSDVPALRSVSYREQELPALANDVPVIVRLLVANILQRNPRKRLGADVAANVMQLFLWAPSAWLQPDGNPSSTEILQWLLSLTTKVLCENRKTPAYPGDADGAAADAFGFKMGRRTYTEYLLISSFLVRARLETVRSAMNWIQNVVVAH